MPCRARCSIMRDRPKAGRTFLSACDPLVAHLLVPGKRLGVPEKAIRQTAPHHRKGRF